MKLQRKLAQTVRIRSSRSNAGHPDLMTAFLSKCANSSGCVPYVDGSLREHLPRRDGLACTLPEMVRAAGCHLFDRSGRHYIDFCNAFGSVFLGHADPVVQHAVRGAVESGVPAAAGRAAAVAVADRIAADLGGEPRTSFFNSGTTAVRAAVNAAQRATGRPWIASAGFHGWDMMWAPPHRPFRMNSSGVFDFYYCVDVLESFLTDHAEKVAAVVISPDYLHCNPDTLGLVIEAGRRAAVVVIADDVKYGYRFAPGPSFRHYGLEADVYVYAKGLANGWPLACVTGDSEILRETKQFASTLAYHIPSLCAAEATLARLDEVGARASITREAGRFVETVSDMLVAAELPIEIVGTPFSFQFIAETTELEAAFVACALDAGVILQPGDQQMPSWAFSGPAVDEAVAALEVVVNSLREMFPHLRGARLSDNARWEAAWSQMDGIGDVSMAGAQRMKFLAEKLANRAW